MKEPILESLIDQYLLGTISPADRTFLESQMASDPSVAMMVEDSKLAYKAILLERNRLLKEKLRRLDQEDLREQHFFPRKLGLVVLWLVIFILIGSLLTTYFSPVKTAQRNFEEYAAMTDVVATSRDDGWEAAERAFRSRDFEKTIQVYSQLGETAEGDERYLINWNILMAQLAAEGASVGWQLSVAAFIDSAPESWSVRAQAMSDMVNSRLYRLWYSPVDQKFSTLKPRLI